MTIARVPVLLSVLLLAALAAPAVRAEGEAMEVKPGLWRTRATTSMEMPNGAPPPRTREREQCVKDGSFEPMEAFDENSGCRVSNVKVEKNVMTFEMTCPAAHGEMKGEARYESDGEKGTGRVEMTMTVGDMQARMLMESTSEWVGDC